MTKKLLSLSLVLILSTGFFATQKALALAEAANHLPADYDWLINFNLSDFADEINPWLDQEISRMQKEVEEAITEERNATATEKKVALLSLEIAKKQLRKDFFWSGKLINSPYLRTSSAFVGGFDLAPESLALLRLLPDLDKFINDAWDAGKDKPRPLAAGQMEALFDENGILNLDDRFLYMGKKEELADIKSDFVNKRGGLTQEAEWNRLQGLLHDKALFSFYLNLKNLIAFVGKVDDSAIITDLLQEKFIATLGQAGISGKKIGDRRFQIKAALTGDPQKMVAADYRYDRLYPPTTFKLWRFLPARDLIFYHEQGGLSYQPDSIANNPFYQEIFSALEEKIGLSVTEFQSLLGRNSAFALQTEKQNLLPYFTLLVETAESDRSATIALTAKIGQAVQDSFSRRKGVNKVEAGAVRPDFHQIKLSSATKVALAHRVLLEGLAAIDSNHRFTEQNLQKYLADRSDNVTIYYGLARPDLFVISNDPHFALPDSGTLSENHPLGSAIAQAEKNSSQYGYLSLATARRKIESVIEDLVFVRDNQPPLKFWSNYHDLLRNFGFVSELSYSLKAEAQTLSATYDFNYDLNPPHGFNARVEKLKADDSDGDGFSDFDENYRRFSNPHRRDAADENRPGPFADLSGGEWYAPFALQLQRAGVLNGYPREQKLFFDGARPISRAEFTKLLIETFTIAHASNYNVHLQNFKPFTDLKDEDWFRPYAVEAFDRHIVKGREKREEIYHNSLRAEELGISIRPITYFDGNAPITRAEALVMLDRTLKFSEFSSVCGDANSLWKEDRSCAGEKATNLGFTDVVADDYFLPSLFPAHELGLMRGSDRQFRPHSPLSRAEAATVISRALAVQTEADSKEITAAENSPFADSTLFREIFREIFSIFRPLSSPF